MKLNKIRERIMEHKNRRTDLRDSIKHSNIHIIGVPEEEREKGAENIFLKIIAEYFPYLQKETDI